MRIALIAPPFISVPPKLYGGTELFIAHLAEGLKRKGIDVVVYANGESTVNAEVRWLYSKSQWPLGAEVFSNMKDLNQAAWAIADAIQDCDIVHLNSAPGLSASRFTRTPFVYTVHHPHEQGLSTFYAYYPRVEYVTISDFQRSRECMPRMRTIHHGIKLEDYPFREKKQPYLSFIGRLAPVKGAHIAIQVAKNTGIPLKIAGEVQPLFKAYYETEIAPHIDGSFIEYIGQADLATKNDLLGNSLAMLFPIQWNEPFGLVMIEAMACGTPVIALKGGSVPEVVIDGVTGYVCATREQMEDRVRNLGTRAAAIRQHVKANFSVDVMVKKYIALYESIYAQEPSLDLAEASSMSLLREPGAAA